VITSRAVNKKNDSSIYNYRPRSSSGSCGHLDSPVAGNLRAAKGKVMEIGSLTRRAVSAEGAQKLVPKYDEQSKTGALKKSGPASRSSAAPKSSSWDGTEVEDVASTLGEIVIQNQKALGAAESGTLAGLAARPQKLSSAEAGVSEA